MPQAFPSQVTPRWSVPRRSTETRALQTLGANLRRERAARGLTQERLAESADLNPRTVQKLEAGTANPGIDVICRIRLALKASWPEMLRVLGADRDE